MYFLVFSCVLLAAVIFIAADAVKQNQPKDKVTAVAGITAIIAATAAVILVATAAKQEQKNE